MSTYVSRYIEVKNKDGNWELLTFLYPFGYNYQREPDVAIGKKKYNIFNHTCDNACLLREYLTSRHHAWKDYGFGDRGFPSDMSEELKEYFKYEYEIPKDNEEKCHDYRYNKSYVHLDELINLYIEEKNKLFKQVLRRIQEFEYNKFHEKLNRLIQVSSLLMNKENLTDEEKEKEVKKNNKVLKNKKEDNDDYYSFEEEMEEFDEMFNEIMSIKNEYVYTWKLVDEIYGYMDDHDIRIVYYFS